jgi:hypothetical protein
LTELRSDDAHWEIFLQEEKKGRVPVSQSGSGLKTILLVLSFLYLAPEIENVNRSNIIYAFEELENNLHPALQRRLLLFLRNVALRDKCVFFLTTHSNVFIDLFSADEHAQIIHVNHDGETSAAKRVSTYIESRGILDDLDVRASDLLQSNGIIWVEGPSDRLYINRWIEIWTNGQLREGAHYQCVFYGGRLLAHLDVEELNERQKSKIQTLRVNRNAAILIDSDKRSSGDSINRTKRRIIEEIDEVGGLAWVTEGREVENYLPRQAIRSLFGVQSARAINKFGDPVKYLNRVSPGAGDRYLRSKVVFAEKVREHITREGMKRRLDLADKVDELCKRIKKWNQIKAEQPADVS